MDNETKSFDAQALRARFNPDGSLLRRMQMCMLGMVSELDRVCRKYGIPYFLYGGTLLGAMRHDGFIPWDDDLDVGLLRRDYLRLMEVLPAELPEHIALQTNDTDPNYFYFFAKLRDRHSLLEEPSPYDRVFRERGVFIDIFPFERQRMWTHLLAEPLQAHTFRIFRTASNLDSAMRRIRAITWTNRHLTFPVLRSISRLTRGRTLTYDYGIPFHLVYDEEDIFPLTTHQFEGIQLSVPGNSHAMLTKQFGNYMQLPDLDKVEGGHIQNLVFY
ncbi:MAG: LicD family protein [Bacteroidaceae bacterium]|nr:LicD family protein [Bacteroidaceae bacterium]